MGLMPTPPWFFWLLWLAVSLWGLTYLLRWRRASSSQRHSEQQRLRRVLLPQDIVYGLVALFVLAWTVYYLPPVYNRLFWRLDFLRARIRLSLSPVGGVPTPVAQGTLRYQTPTPTATFTPQPSATATPTLATTPTPTLTPSPTPSPTPVPPSVILQPPPRWERQTANNCGPATLTMYLNWWGWEGDQEDIAQRIRPNPKDKNVNVEELVFFVRNYAGWLNVEYRVGGTVELLKRIIASGLPVMIEWGIYLERAYWPNDDRWAGHFLLLTGYDDTRGIFIAQDSLRGLNQEYTYEEVDAQWKTFNRVFIVVYHPRFEETVKSVLGPYWDMDVSRQIALEQAQAEIEANPEDAFAWFNLGTNLVYFEKWHEAAKAYDKARELGLPQRFLRYQFGPFFAYFHSWRLEDLQALIEYALKITPVSEEVWVWRGWLYYRLGDREEAIRSFRKAYELNPTFPDAQYALRQLGVTP